MSDATGPPRACIFYPDDMIGLSKKVYADGLDQDGFTRDGLVYDATLRNLELIGEAAPHIPETVRAADPHVPWRLIVATRNRLIHGYLGIDNDTVCSVVRDDPPARLEQLRELRDRSVSTPS